jgi:hypothetical protein
MTLHYFEIDKPSKDWTKARHFPNKFNYPQSENN